MFGFEEIEKPTTNCFATHAALPPIIDPKQPPQRRKPFSTICSHRFNHTVELVLEEDVYNVIATDLEASVPRGTTSRVIMSLSELLDGAFFHDFVKLGNVLMFTEGRVGVDNTFSLCDGLLTLLLDKESYERAGLVGVPTGTTGTKRSKARWKVEINLRLPSMVHGKKGFERIVWAFKNVLTRSVTWLYHDLDAKDELSPATPLATHHPSISVNAAEVFRIGPVLIPTLQPPLDDEAGKPSFDEHMTDIFEWLSLVSLRSPRIDASDTVDPYLSRYEVPGSEEAKSARVVLLRWRGLLSARWITELWLTSLRLIRKARPESWFAINVYSLGSGSPNGVNGYAILRLPSPARSADGPPYIGANASLPLPPPSPDSFVVWEMNGP
ncbi:MAG: hypothetical protein M1838_003636 [Thelocarpon superellum]|nr:MAG: hypothetical protein M1838_003636 [Thelocarpon superellum]